MVGANERQQIFRVGTGADLSWAIFRCFCVEGGGRGMNVAGRGEILFARGSAAHLDGLWKLWQISVFTDDQPQVRPRRLSNAMFLAGLARFVFKRAFGARRLRVIRARA